MVRRKTQKAGANAKRIKNESYRDALKRDYVFFYHKWKGEQVPKEKRFIEPEQEEEIKRVLLNAKRRGMEEDTIVREIFKEDPVKFQQELSDWEEYKPDGFLNKGTAYERRAFPLAKSLDRFIGTIQASPKQIQYRSDFMVNICEQQNFDQTVKSLTEDFCITVLTEDMKSQFEENRGSGYPTSYIIVKPDFFPSRVTLSGGPITLNARSIPTISFLLDAFQQRGIVEIEPTLYTTLQREAPELLRFSAQEPIVLITPSSLGELDPMERSFLVVKEGALPRLRNVVNLKNFPGKPIVKQLFANQQVLFLDAKTMYELRRNFLDLWRSNFGDANLAMYKTLTPHEQLVFGFLEFTKILEMISSSLNTAAGNNETIARKKMSNAIENASGLVFGTEYTPETLYELLENFQMEDEENLRQMIKLQQSVLGSVKIRTPDDLKELLQKFDPNAPKREQVSVSYPQEILNQRAVLLKAYQNSFKAPVSSSRIPSFLRTRKAKNNNLAVYKQRIRNAKARLLAFDKEHNLPFSKGAEQYNF